MTGADRTLLALMLAAAVVIAVLAATSRTDVLRILGFFIAAAIAWGGIAYAWAIITASPPG